MRFFQHTHTAVMRELQTFSNLIVATAIGLLLSGCWLFHDYDVCTTDAQCSYTHECEDGLCRNRPEYPYCNPNDAFVPPCPAGTTCDTDVAACVPVVSVGGDADGSNLGDVGFDTAQDEDAGVDEAGSDGGDVRVDGSGDDEDVAPDMPIDPDHPAPTGVTASDGIFDDRVRVEWFAPEGAESYRIFRDGSEIARGVSGILYEDFGALREAPSADGFDLVASDGEYEDFVRLMWAEPDVVVQHEYTVMAQYDDGESVASVGDAGCRSTPPITSYQIEIGLSETWTDVGLLTTYDDTTATAGVLVPGTVAASDGDSIYHVALTISGVSSEQGPTHTYRVRAMSDLGDGVASASETGFRGSPNTAVQWQRSESDIDGDYVDIEGATGGSYFDVDAQLDGSIRFYRARVGSGDAVSTTDDGYRSFVELDDDIQSISGEWAAGFYRDDVRIYHLDDGLWSLADTVDLPYTASPQRLSLSGDSIVVWSQAICDYCQPNGWWSRVSFIEYDAGLEQWSETVSFGPYMEQNGHDVDHFAEWAIHGTSYGHEYSLQLYYLDSDTETWSEDGTLSSGIDDDRYGYHVSISNDLIASVAPYGGTNGLVYVYRLNDGTWHLEDTLSTDEDLGDAEFGANVSVDGDWIGVGIGELGGSLTAIQLFRKDAADDAWVPEDRLIPSGEFSFRRDIAISGDTLAFCEYGLGAHVYKYQDTEGWVEWQLLQQDVSGSVYVDISDGWMAIDNRPYYVGD